MRLSRICLILSFAVSFYFSSVESKYFVSFRYVYAQDRLQEAQQHYEKGNDFYKQRMFKEAQEEYQKALLVIPQEENKGDNLKNTAADSQTEEIPPLKILKYTISEGDTLKISVWEWDNLNQEVIVRPDGMISFPLAGEIQASGLTIPQLTEEMTRRLKEYIKSPQVSISVIKIGGRKIIVLGEVVQPGVYEVTGRKTVLEAAALARGFTKDAVLSSVIVIRGGFQNPKGERLNLARAISKADMSQNVVLEPEDIVYVPKKFIANVNYFVNQVMGPLIQGFDNAAKMRTGIRSGSYYMY